MRKTKEPKQRCVFAHFAHTIAPLRGGCFNQQFHLPSFRERGMARHTPLFKVNMHSHPSAARHITPATSVAAARHHRKHTRRERRAQTHTNSLWGHTRKLPTCLWHVTFAGCNVAKKKKKKRVLQGEPSQGSSRRAFTNRLGAARAKSRAAAADCDHGRAATRFTSLASLVERGRDE